MECPLCLNPVMDNTIDFCKEKDKSHNVVCTGRAFNYRLKISE